MSREALRRFGERQPSMCASDQGAEDVEFGRCMEKLGECVVTNRSSTRHGTALRPVVLSVFHQFPFCGSCS